MKIFLVLFSTLLLFHSVTLTAQKKPKVLFVIVDGIAADQFENGAMPFAHQLAKSGTYSRMYVGGEKDGYSQTPTISAVGYNSLITGVWFNKHNVNDNAIKAPNYHYKNIFRWVKELKPELKTAIYSTWQDNRTKLIGHQLADAGNIGVDYYADGFELDTLNYPHDNQKNYIHLIDEKVVDIAHNEIVQKAPDLTWVYLEYTDDMGHKYGDSPKFQQALTYADRQLEKLYEAIQRRSKNNHEEWLFMVTTDHGRSEEDGKDHGGQSPRQRSTWFLSNQKMDAHIRSYEPAIVDILPTMLQHLGLRIPQAEAFELDGMPLNSPIQAFDLKTNYIQGKIDVSWKVFPNQNINGTCKIWLSETNHFNTGGKDSYRLIKELHTSEQHFTIDVTNQKSPFYKVIVEFPNYSLNRWVRVP